MSTGADGPEHPSRLWRWRHVTFGPASEQPYRRRTSDWIRLAISVAVVAFAIAHESHPGEFEKNLYALLNGLPNDLRTFFRALYGLGTLWAVGLVVVAALVARRWRLACDMVIAGALAWFIGRLLGGLVAVNADLEKSLDIVTRFGDATPSFPVVRLAVVVAVVTTAGPYLGRPMRRLGQLLVVLLAAAALYLGTGDPNALLAAVALGWGLGAAVHLAFGSPGGRPTRAQVTAALAELGISASRVDLAPTQPLDGTLMLARDRDGPLRIRVLGRDEADAQLVSKLWRGLLYKDSGTTVHLTRLQDVEHQAYTLLLAERAGARVPDVVVAGTAGPNAALLVERPVGGKALSDVPAKEVTVRVLNDAWRQLVRIHAGRVAHGRLNTHHVFLTPDGVAVADFEHASGAASPDRRAADVAELLTSTAEIVGNDRAVAAALRGVGKQELTAALPFLQTAALSHEMRPRTHHARKEMKEQISALRDTAARAVGTEPPPLQQLYRVNTTSLLMAVGTLIAVFALLSQVGDPEEFYETIKNADWAWLAAALVISFLTNFATAVSLMGTVPITLPLIRTAELQLSMSFSNLAVPAVGGMAAQIRFLQKQGVDLASAVASGGLLANVGNIFACALLFIVAFFLSPTTIDTGEIPVSEIVKIAILAAVLIGIVTVLIFKVPKLRTLVLPPVKSAVTTMRDALRSPRRVFELLVGNIVNALMYATVMLFCIYAFGGSINFWTLLAINIFVSTLASLVPIPGGGTAVSAVGMSGALTAVGIPTEVAVAAVLANQLVANFIPAVPGWFATNNLLHDDYL
ncbi:MAG TPA: lysylphosphatidylglycerol synthase transmembrane domain-containing protein [Acidimicrobiia bacterium]